MELESIEVLADRTAQSRCDEGFLRVERYVLQNRYADGSTSEPYPCDVVTRVRSEAVVALLYAVEETPAGTRVSVVLRDAPRAPVVLRRRADPAAARAALALREVVAGLVEAEDGGGPEGLCRRASLEALEEAGASVPAERFSLLGEALFASPGMGDERVAFAAAPVELEALGTPAGDGSVMEEGARVVVLELGEAIAACRRGAIRDMKTEVALLRLADHLGLRHP